MIDPEIRTYETYSAKIEPYINKYLDKNDRHENKAFTNSSGETYADIDTSELHYVKVPENHIVIDFDIPDKNGNKSLKKNKKVYLMICNN